MPRPVPKTCPPARGVAAPEATAATHRGRPAHGHRSAVQERDAIADPVARDRRGVGDAKGSHAAHHAHALGGDREVDVVHHDGWAEEPEVDLRPPRMSGVRVDKEPISVLVSLSLRET